jgi:hypothetical protein
MTHGNPDERTRTLTATNMAYLAPGEKLVARIIGYGHAVYAVRIDNTVIIDWNWYTRSISTKKHLGIIEDAARSSDDVNLVYVNGPLRSLFKLSATTERILGALPWTRDELPELGPVNARPGGGN